MLSGAIIIISVWRIWNTNFSKNMFNKKARIAGFFIVCKADEFIYHK